MTLGVTPRWKMGISRPSSANDGIVRIADESEFASDDAVAFR